MSTYAGKTAVITGGSTGIGLATAQLLARGGAKVIITARSKDALEVATKELGANVTGVVSDTSNLADIDALVGKVKSTLQAVDFLFVNAGIAKFAALEAVNEAFYDETMNINIKGAFFTIQRLAPLMRAGAGIVLNTSVVDVKGMPMTSVYAASKAALRSLSRTLAGELVGKNIRVNAVSPGPITTPIYGKMGMPKEAVDGFAQQMRDGNPMKRFGTAEEVARAALFLGFDATYTTGAELVVDGGLTQL